MKANNLSVLSLLSSILVSVSAQSPSSSPLPYRGVDWSSQLVSEAAGITYKAPSSSTVQPVETILRNNGVNIVRQRLWVNPSDGNYNLAYNLKLAKRAKDAGLKIYLDMHFSDTWADPGHQKPPAAWPTDLASLNATLFNYTRSVCNSFAAANLSLELISIGNEINPGILLPTGSVSKSYQSLSTLLHSAAAGIKASTLTPVPKIMVHLSDGWNWSTQKGFYTSLLAVGAGKGGFFANDDFDVMGVSYYPFYNSAATLQSLSTSLTNMGHTFGKEIMVVETDWPVSCPKPGNAFPSDAQAVPFTIPGQETWMKDVTTVMKNVSKSGAGNVTGLYYWEPMWVANANLGSSCADVLMVEQNGAVRASIEVFNEL